MGEKFMPQYTQTRGDQATKKIYKKLQLSFVIFVSTWEALLHSI